mmetsp:Transcript_14988/g.44412  ORF Transcript_14988/g.44412 Transcript_14988/m.44412 type:complete len:210 (+) Transcript_14988:3400-4029(+)
MSSTPGPRWSSAASTAAGCPRVSHSRNESRSPSRPHRAASPCRSPRRPTRTRVSRTFSSPLVRWTSSQGRASTASASCRATRPGSGQWTCIPRSSTLNSRRPLASGGSTSTTSRIALSASTSSPAWPSVLSRPSTTAVCVAVSFATRAARPCSTMRSVANASAHAAIASGTAALQSTASRTQRARCLPWTSSSRRLPPRPRAPPETLSE